jgi:hypothetical protein
MDTATNAVGPITQWNRGKPLGQKPPLKLKEFWALPISTTALIIERASPHCSTRHRRQLRGCDLRINEVLQGGSAARLSFIRRLSDLCSSRSPSRQETRSPPG